MDKEEDISRWKTIYPAYLNSNRTQAEGRRISKRKSCSDPRWQEIKDVLESTGTFEVVGQPDKVYPRELDKETPANRGRVRYRIVAESTKFNSKKDILIFAAEMIPKLKSRTQKPAAQTTSDQTTAGGKKKKGKK